MANQDNVIKNIVNYLDYLSAQVTSHDELVQNIKQDLRLLQCDVNKYYSEHVEEAIVNELTMLRGHQTDKVKQTLQAFEKALKDIYAERALRDNTNTLIDQLYSEIEQYMQQSKDEQLNDDLECLAELRRQMNASSDTEKMRQLSETL